MLWTRHSRSRAHTTQSRKKEREMFSSDSEESQRLASGHRDWTADGRELGGRGQAPRHPRLPSPGHAGPSAGTGLRLLRGWATGGPRVAAPPPPPRRACLRPPDRPSGSHEPPQTCVTCPPCVTQRDARREERGGGAEEVGVCGEEKDGGSARGRGEPGWTAPPLAPPPTVGGSDDSG